MAKKVTSTKPLFGNKRSHSCRATRHAQKPNLQKVTLDNGTSLDVTTSEFDSGVAVVFTQQEYINTKTGVPVAASLLFSFFVNWGPRDTKSSDVKNEFAFGSIIDTLEAFTPLLSGQ